jgi:hypothetical protein
VTCAADHGVDRGRVGNIGADTMTSLEQELADVMTLDVEPIIEQIKAEGGGLDGLGKIIEQVVLPLLASHKVAMLRLAREVDDHRAAIADLRPE